MDLIVMLTHNDKTVQEASLIFEQAKTSKAKYFGIKEAPLSLEEMKKLFQAMKSCRKQTCLEVVSYTESEGLRGAQVAVECKCDFLLGTKYFDSINQLCNANNIKYLPFVGTCIGRPTVLQGNIDDIILEARQLVDKGVFGFDLLGYRYDGNAKELNKRFTSEVKSPVCIAGSVDSFQRLDELKETNPWTFTIGGAFFEKKFGDSFVEQINTVCDYIEKINSEK